MADSVLFSRVMEEYGSQEKEKEEEEQKTDRKREEKAADSVKDKGAGKKTHLMQAEERLTGSVSTTVYAKYLRFAGGLIWAPVILAMLVAYQGAQGEQYILTY